MKMLAGFQRKIYLPWFISVMLLGACNAEAQSSSKALPPQAQAAYDNAMAAAKERQWEIASRNFEEARRGAWEAPDKLAEILFNQGLAESHLSCRELRAIVLFEAYLGAAPVAPNAAKVRIEIAKLETKAEATCENLIRQAKQLVQSLPDGLPDRFGDNPAKQDKGYRLNNLIGTQARLGDVEGAKTSAAALNDYWKWAAYVNIAANLADLGKFDEAKKVGAIIPLDNPAYWSCIYEIGKAQAELGKFNEAKKVIAIIPLDNPAYWGGIKAIGTAQAKFGDIAGAVAMRELLFPRDRLGAWHLDVEICKAQIRVGDIDGAKKTASGIMTGLSLKDKALALIADAEEIRKFASPNMRTYTKEEIANSDDIQAQIAARFAKPDLTSNTKEDLETSDRIEAEMDEISVEEFRLRRRLALWLDLLTSKQDSFDLSDPTFTNLPNHLRSTLAKTRAADIIKELQSSIDEIIFALHTIRQTRTNPAIVKGTSRFAKPRRIPSTPDQERWSDRNEERLINE